MKIIFISLLNWLSKFEINLFQLNGSAKETPKKEGKSPKKEAKTPKQEVKTPKQEVKTPKQDVKTPKQDAKTPKQEGKTPKQDGKTPKAEAKTPKQEGKTPKADAAATPKSVKKTMKGGIAIEEIKEGTGPECKVTTFTLRLKKNCPKISSPLSINFKTLLW